MSWLGLQPLPEYLFPTETKYPPWRAERVAGEAAARAVRRAMVKVVEIIFAGIMRWRFEVCLIETAQLEVWIGL